MKKTTFFLALSLPLALHAELGLELIAGGVATGWAGKRNAALVADADGDRLVLDGKGAQVNLDIPLKPEWGQLKLSMLMKVTGAVCGEES